MLVKLLGNKDEIIIIILKAEKKECITYRWKTVRKQADFLSEIAGYRKQWKNNFKILTDETKADHWLPGEEGEGWERAEKEGLESRHKEIFRSSMFIILVVVIVSRVYKNVKMYPVLHFKYLKCIICQLQTYRRLNFLKLPEAQLASYPCLWHVLLPSTVLLFPPRNSLFTSLS